MTEALSFLFLWMESLAICRGYYCYPYLFAVPLATCLLLVMFRKNSLSKAKKVGHFENLSWRQMEYAAKDFYKSKGYSVVIKGGNQADGGVDLIVTRRGLRILVQVKHYKSKVGVKVVREMLGVLIDSKEFDAIHIVSSTDFTRPARELADRHKVRLIGKRELFS